MTTRRLALTVACVAAVSVMTSAIGCAPRPRVRAVEGGPVETGAGTTRAARDYLEGNWTLLSFQVRPPGRDPIQVKGTGLLTYDAYGNMKMEIRVDEATGQALTKAGIPLANGTLSTEGRVAVDVGRKVLTYIVEGQPALGAPSGPLATNRPRYWQVEGNVLTLTTKDDQGNPVSVGTWQKK